MNHVGTVLFFYMTIAVLIWQNRFLQHDRSNLNKLSYLLVLSHVALQFLHACKTYELPLKVSDPMLPFEDCHGTMFAHFPFFFFSFFYFEQICVLHFLIPSSCKHSSTHISSRQVTYCSGIHPNINTRRLIIY